MLAFTRRPNESFLIGEDIVVKVLGRDDHGNIQFGIEGSDDAECLKKLVQESVTPSEVNQNKKDLQCLD
jgi:sRNA-binding carbon storage regulator CsrA